MIWNAIDLDETTIWKWYDLDHSIFHLCFMITHGIIFLNKGNYETHEKLY